MPFEINWGYGCRRVYCPDTICQASEGIYTIFMSLLPSHRTVFHSYASYSLFLDKEF